MVCLSVGMSVTVVGPAKTAGPIEMPFGLWTHVGRFGIFVKLHVLWPFAYVTVCTSRDSNTCIALYSAK